MKQVAVGKGKGDKQQLAIASAKNTALKRKEEPKERDFKFDYYKPPSEKQREKEVLKGGADSATLWAFVTEKYGSLKTSLGGSGGK